METFIFLRHGQTAGNQELRYVGRTDEPLCSEGISALSSLHPPTADWLFVSPLRRCLESAALLYPRLTPTIIPGFQECDFGAFEYKNHIELADDPRYQAWIDSGGTLPFPDGESRSSFSARCRAAFLPLLADPRPGCAALVVHGGTLMALLEAFALPLQDYFSYQVNNGHGFLCQAHNGALSLLKRL